MRKFLFFVTYLMITLSSVAQVKLNVWDKNPKVALSMNKMKASSLPSKFESKTPDGETVVYERWKVPTITFQSSKGKKINVNPVVYKAKDNLNFVTYGVDGWKGIYQSKKGKLYSMAPQKVAEDTSMRNKIENFCSSPLIPPPTQSEPKPEVGKTIPETSRLVTTDFYDKTVMINKQVTVYAEVTNDIHVLLGNNFATTQDWVTNLFLAVSQLYLNEGLNVSLVNSYIWETVDPYGYTTLSTSGEALAMFGSKIGSNIPVNPNAQHAHLLSFKSYGGLANVGGNSEGYTPSTYQTTGRGILTGVSGISSFSLPTNLSNMNKYFWPVYVVTHELGHNFGSKHSHWCGWYNDTGVQIGRLDSCGSGINEQGTGPINICGTNGSYSPTPTIMSYCHQYQTGTTQINALDKIFLNGFGKYPRFAIRSSIYARNDIPFPGGSLPTLTTTSATSVTSSSSTTGGNVTDDGGNPVSSKGIVWSTSPNPTTSLTTKTNNGVGTGSFTVNLTGLTGGTTYYVRSYAINLQGTQYGNEIQFTTSAATIPTLDPTTTVTSITNSIATSGGVITNANGASVTAKGVVWSTSANPTVSLTTKTNNGSGTSSFTSNLTGLSPSTTYYVRSYATNSAGTGYGNQVTFTTLSASSVLISTTALGTIGCYNVTTGGNITSDGGSAITSRGVVWGTSSNPTTSLTTKSTSGTGTGSYSITVNNLSPSTTYYIRSFAVNTGGTTYGDQFTFTTPALPSITTNAATAGYSSITIPYVLNLGTNTSMNNSSVFIGTTNPPTNTNNFRSGTTKFNPVSGNYTSSVSSADGLPPQAGTTYYCRAYVQDVYGNTFYSNNTISATTPTTAAPVCTTLSVTGVSSPSTTQSIATVTAQALNTNDSYSNVFRAILYNTSPNVTPSTGKQLSAFNCTSDANCVLSYSINFNNPTIGNNGNLQPNTTYYVRSYVVNSVGSCLGNEISFTTPAYVYNGPPLVQFDSIKDPTPLGATFFGQVTSNGGSTLTQKGFVMSSVYPTPTVGTGGGNCLLDANFNPQCWSATQIPFSSSTGSYSVNFGSGNALMKPNTTYYVRAYATNSNGTGYSNNVRTFTTLATISAPSITTTSASAITNTSVTTGGNITSNGGSTVTASGVCYSTTSNPTTSSPKVTSVTVSGPFTVSLTGLTPSTLYYARAYATNSQGTSYGSQITFTTAASVTIPTVSTNTTTLITGTTATSGGNVTSTGGATVTARGICYSTSTTPSLTNGTVITSGSGTGTFSVNITGLSTGTIYYIRAYATNSSGTAYGTQQQFTTLSIASLSTTTASSILSTSAITGGNVTSDGGSTITERGVCYGTTSTPTTGDLKVVATGTTGTFTSSLTGLLPNTTYFVRAYAINSVGTAYGTQITFTTTVTLTTPTLTTTTPTSITTTTASSGGNITSDGGASVTARGVCWSTSTAPTIALSTKTSNGTGTGTFTSSITGLSPGITYYIRSYATNSVGTAYGTETTFTTTTTTPTLTSTTAVSAITQTTATSGGVISVDGGASISARGVCWSTSINPTVSLSTKTNDGSGTGTFTSNLTGLSPITTYYVRAYATNTNGTSYGPQVSFTTLSTTTIPTVSTVVATSISTTSALSGGQVSADGGVAVTSRGVVWSTSANPTIALSTKTINGTGTGPFSSNITGLSALTTYYYRAYATNSNGTAYGTQYTFITLANTPTLTTTAINSITLTSASSGGNITNDGGAVVTARGVCWSTTSTPTISDSKTTDGTGAGIFTSTLTGLTQNTTYNVRAYATNSVGTSYGNEVSFTTGSPILPTVTTTSVSSVDFTSAVSGGVVTSDGFSTVTSRGVCWSTSPNPTTSNSSTSDGTGTGSFTSNITGLSPGTTYYVRAYAINTTGTAYGTQVSFTTVPGQSPTITTDDINNVTSSGAQVIFSITSLGGGSMSLKGFCYSTSPNPNTSSSKVEDLCDVTIPCDVAQYTYTFLETLLPNTTYYVRAYGINEYGTSYGQQLTFTTLIGFPTTTTNTITSITSNSAVSGGTITSASGGTISAKGVCWSTSSNPTLANSFTNDGSGTGSFTSNLTGLSAATTYYVRSYATNQTGTGYGNQVGFTTSSVSLPLLTTTVPSSITTTTATSGGNISSDGGSSVTSRGVCWSTSANPTTSNSKTTDGTGVGGFTSSINGLVSGTTYYLRAYATNANGTSYGNQVSFSTTSALPTLSTVAISGITSTTASSGGTITSNGGSVITTKGICWSTSPNPTVSLSTKTNNGSGSNSFVSTLNSLSPSTTYYVRSYATNANGTAYGNQVSFTTSASSSGSCAVTGLTVTKTGCSGSTCNYTFSFNINPNCTSYTVNVCRYSNALIGSPPTSGQTPVACAVRNNMTNYVPSSSEINAGIITRTMSPAPSLLNYWYSVDVTCNSSTCTGAKTTRSSYFYNAP